MLTPLDVLRTAYLDESNSTLEEIYETFRNSTVKEVVGLIATTALAAIPGGIGLCLGFTASAFQAGLNLSEADHELLAELWKNHCAERSEDCAFADAGATNVGATYQLTVNADGSISLNNIVINPDTFSNRKEYITNPRYSTTYPHAADARDISTDEYLDYLNNADLFSRPGEHRNTLSIINEGLAGSASTGAPSLYRKISLIIVPPRSCSFPILDSGGQETPV
jgi:hypothetical protein